MLQETDILIAGGGLAGLTSAIHLSKAGFKVILLEKNMYPHHKVCGEYVSNEVLPYLQALGADPLTLKPALLSQLLVSTASGRSIQAPLPLGGFGISRYTLDHFLYRKALEMGCTVITDTVTDIYFENELFTITTPNDTFKATLVLGAYGKRATLDHKLQRNFIRNKSPWLAVKAHYRGDFPDNLVALHNFKGGYCGISKIEQAQQDGNVKNTRGDVFNICYLVDYATFKMHKNMIEHRENVLYKNKYLRQVFEHSVMEFELPLSIGQISFERKEAVKDHVLMIGDTAGLIHPLCGNGMGMAIHSAKICSELVIKYFRTIAGAPRSRKEMEATYAKSWQENFNRRLLMGRLLSGVLRKDHLTECLLNGLANFPALLPLMIKQTHGKPFTLTPSCL